MNDQNKVSVNDDFLTVGEVAKGLKIDAGTVYRLMSRGILKHVGFPGTKNPKNFTRRIRVKDLEDFLNENYHDGRG